MTVSDETKIDEFYTLAKYLKQHQDGILKKWEEQLYKEEQVTKLVELSREKFHDHVPIFLDLLCERLRNIESSPEDIAKAHGAHRWEHGLDLREVSKEWAKLHEVLAVYIDSAAEARSISYNVQKRAHAIVAKLIHEGIQYSIDEFYQLQDREAQAQMKDLESALSKREFQGENLQQTSHDLKGILFSLQVGFSLLEDKDLDDETRQVLNEMSLAAESLEQFLTNLLDLFRLEAGEEEMNITSFDIATVISEMCDSLRPLAEFKDLNLRCRGDETFQVEGDRGKMQRIIQNLLINALKYTDKGHVDISWELESDDDWRLTISDTGPGLSKTRAASLSTESDDQKQADSDEESHGEGIGLLIVRRLTKLLNGVIDINTAPEEGTTFKLIFPLEYDADN